MTTTRGIRKSKGHSHIKSNRWILFVLVAFQGLLLFRFISKKSYVDDAAPTRPAKHGGDIRIGALDEPLLDIQGSRMSVDLELLRQVSQNGALDTIDRFGSSTKSTKNASAIFREQDTRLPTAEGETLGSEFVSLESELPEIGEALHLDLANSIEGDVMSARLVVKPFPPGARKRSAREEGDGGTTTCMEQGWDFNGGRLLGSGTYGRVEAVQVSLLLRLCEPGPSADDCQRITFSRAKIRHPHIIDFFAALGNGLKTTGVALKTFSNRTLGDVWDEDRSRELDVASVGFQIASALEYLHAEGFQGTNISKDSLQASRHTGELLVKLVDVPIAPGISNVDKKIADPLDADGDVHALGTLLLSLLGDAISSAGKLSEDNEVTRDKDLVDIIESCISAHAGDRPSAAAVAKELEDVYFKLLGNKKKPVDRNSGSQRSRATQNAPDKGHKQRSSKFRNDTGTRRHLEARTEIDPNDIDLSLATVDCLCGFEFGGVQSKLGPPPTERHECPWSEAQSDTKSLFHIQLKNISQLRRAEGYTAGYFWGLFTVAVKTHENKFRPANMEEMVIHSELAHPNIIQFLGVAVGHTNVGWLPTGFVLESFPEGSLHKMLSNKQMPMSYAFRLEVALQFAQSLAYLHGKNMVHFDIKPHNVLVKRGLGSVEDTVVKLIDFGFSLKMDGEWLDMRGRSTTRHVWGTRKYAAPELFVDVANVTEKADVFSFGVTLWKMYTRRSPRSGFSKEEITQRWRNGTMPQLKIPTSCEREWAEMIHECTKVNAADRPSMESVARKLATIRESLL